MWFSPGTGTSRYPVVQGSLIEITVTCTCRVSPMDYLLTFLTMERAGADLCPCPSP